MMLSMMVVRPAPLRPTRDTTSLSSTLIDTPCRYVRRAAKGIDVVDFEQHGLRLYRSGRQRNAEQDVGDVLVRLDLVRRPVGEK